MSAHNIGPMHALDRSHSPCECGALGGLVLAAQKKRPRSDAATDGDRLGRLIGDGGPDQTQVQPKPEVLRAGDRPGYPQALAVDQKILR